MNKTKMHNKHHNTPVAGRKTPRPIPAAGFRLVPDEEDLPLDPVPVFKPGKFQPKDKNKVRAMNGQSFRNEPVPRPLFLKCGKCGTTMPEYTVDDHLLKCQPNGAVCDICKKLIPAVGFLEHIKNCKGEK
jgi:hypothetical protein